MSDTILDKVAAGIPGAVEQCLARYGGLVWSLARRLSPTEGDAEDAVQEIFLELWRHARRFDPHLESSEATYIAMIARRRLIDRHRKRARQIDTVNLEDARTISESDLPDSLEGADEVQRVRTLLKQLRPEERQVLELTFFQGLTQSEISRRIPMPLGTVKTHARRGLIRLRELTTATTESLTESEP